MKQNFKKTPEPMQTLTQCAKLAGELADKIQFEVVKPSLAHRTEYEKGISGAKVRINDCMVNHEQATEKHNAAIIDRDNKKAIFLKANEQLRYAESSYYHLMTSGRGTEQDATKMAEITSQVKTLQDATKAAEQSVLMAKNEQGMTGLYLNNARRDFADLQAAKLIKETIFKLGLFDTIQHATLLIRSKKPEMTANELKAELMTAFFNAVLEEGKIPSFSQSRDFLNKF